MTRGRTIRSGKEMGSSAGPLTATVVAVSSLSVGWGLVVTVVFGVHLTTSARFRARAPGPVSVRLSTTISGRALSCRSWFPVAFRPPALASWSSFARPGVELSLRSADRTSGRTRTGFPCSARTSCDRGGCPLYSGDNGARPDRSRSPASAAASQRQSLHPATTIHPYGALHYEASTKGSRVFTRPIFPSPVAAGWNGSVLGFTPSFAPRSYERRTSRWGQVIEHGPEPTLYVIDLASNPALITRYVRPRVARDDAEADATRPQQALGTRIDGTEGRDWREPGRALLRHPRAEEVRLQGRAFRARGVSI